MLVVVDGVTVAVRVTVSFALSDAVVLFNEIPVAGVSTTVTLHVAVRLLPSVVVAVIVAVPTLRAVTTPSLDTVATEVSELLQVTVLFCAAVGNTFAISVIVSLVLSVATDLFNERLVTSVGSTVTLHVALRLVPSVVVAVIFAVPTALAVTTPVLDTVATEVFELFQFTFLFDASEGVTVTVRVSLSSTSSVTAFLFNEMPVASVASTVT